MKKLLIYFSLFVIVIIFTLTRKVKPSTITLCYYNGLSESYNTFTQEDDGLYLDNISSFNEVEDEYYNIKKNRKINWTETIKIPIWTLFYRNGTYGLPEVMDQGGILIKFKIFGVSKKFNLDPDMVKEFAYGYFAHFVKILPFDSTSNNLTKKYIPITYSKWRSTLTKEKEASLSMEKLRIYDSSFIDKEINDTLITNAHITFFIFKAKDSVKVREYYRNLILLTSFDLRNKFFVNGDKNVYFLLPQSVYGFSLLSKNGEYINSSFLDKIINDYETIFRESKDKSFEEIRSKLPVQINE